MKIETIRATIRHRVNPDHEFTRLVQEIESLFDGMDIKEELQEIYDRNDRNRDSFVRNSLPFLHAMDENLIQVNRVCRNQKEYALLLYPDDVKYAEITDLPVAQAMEIMTEIVCRRMAA